MRSDMKRHMQMHPRDGSDVSLLLACAEQGIDPLEAITADPDALAVCLMLSSYHHTGSVLCGKEGRGLLLRIRWLTTHPIARYR